MDETSASSHEKDLSSVYISGQHSSTVFIDVILIAIIVISVAGNLSVCVAVGFHPALRKPSNIFIASLALADLLVAILVMPFSLSPSFIHGNVFGPVVCKAWVAFDLAFSSTSVLHLCLVSIDRYVHIKKPFVYKRWMTTTKAVQMSTVCWLFKALTSFLPAYLGLFKEEGSFVATDDAMNLLTTTSHYQTTNMSEWHLAGFVFCNHAMKTQYIIATSIIDFVIPCGIIIFVYARIFHLIRKRAQNIRHGRLVKNGRADEKNGTSREEFRINNQNISHHKAAIVLGFIIGLFFICWMPFFIDLVVCSLQSGCRSFFSKTAAALSWLGYINSCLNPCVYAISTPEFRQSFKDLIFRKQNPRRLSKISRLQCRNRRFRSYAAESRC